MSKQSWHSYSLDEVKDLSILAVCDQLGLFVMRRGKNHWCKLRDERIPSTILHSENNTFYDFGTQEHGSNIDLVCKVTGKPFDEAVRYLGDAFALQPESPAQARHRFRTMSKTEYARIGLHWDLATKNFSYPIDRCSADKLVGIELRYQMSMNALRKKHPKTYERILREKAVPYVEQLRNLYYLEIWNHYCLLQTLGRTFLFYDSERTQQHFSGLTHQLEQAEKALYKAGQGTGLSIPEPSHYDPLRVISRFLTDRLRISIGPCSVKEFSGKGNGTSFSFDVPIDCYYDATLEDLPHAAELSKDHVTITCYKYLLPLFRNRLAIDVPAKNIPALTKTITAAETHKEKTKMIAEQREPVLTR